MRKNILFHSILFISLFSCQSKQQEDTQVSTIDSTLQVKATSILENKLSELNALSGQTIIMEVQTGQIKAMVGLERKDSVNYQPSENFFYSRETGLMRPVSILAALETRKVLLSDTVDVGEGVYSIQDRELKDHNWHRSGYGKLTIKEGLAAGSNIAIYKTVEKSFKPQSYSNQLNKMDYGKPDSIVGIAKLKPAFINVPTKETTFAWLSIGYEQKIAPIQILTFYNAIANNGKMVQPQLYKDSTTVINPQIASQANIDSLKQALEYIVTDGFGQSAKSKKVKVAGESGTAQLEDESYLVEFCGYFPADNPQYSIIVSINKEGLPAAGFMAGEVFRQIVDYMVE